MSNPTGTFTGLIILFFITMFISFITYSNTFASTYSASISVGGSVNLNVSPAGNGANVVTDNLTVSSTCPLGYTVSISGPSDATLYQNGDNTSSNKISASTGTKASPAPVTGTSNLGTWGYSTTNSTATGNFIGLTNSTVEIYSKQTASASGGDTIPVYYGASVPATLPMGTYTMYDSSNTGKITYYLTADINCLSYVVHFNANGGSGNAMPDQRIAEGIATTLDANTYAPPTGLQFNGWTTNQDGTGTVYSDQDQVTNLTTVGPNNTITLYAQWATCPRGNICYDGNGATAGVMDNQSVGTSTISARLIAYNYKRPNYGFLGWSTVSNPIIGIDTIYGPMEDITFPALSSEGLKLYAVWLEKNSAYTMQNFSSSICENELAKIVYDSSTSSFHTENQTTLTADSFIALRDERDNDVYAVARLSDGNCWMLENLRIDGSVSATDMANGSQGTGGVFTKLPNSVDDAWQSNTYNDVYGSELNLTTATLPQINTNNTNIGGTNSSGISLIASYNDNNNYSQWYGYGNVYSWAAASATTVLASSDSATTTSICPSNWQLPSRSRYNTYSYPNLSASMGGLNTQMSSSTNPTADTMASRFSHFPNNFVYSGWWWHSTSSTRSENWYFWTSNSYNPQDIYVYRYTGPKGKMDTDALSVIGQGWQIRCVASS